MLESRFDDKSHCRRMRWQGGMDLLCFSSRLSDAFHTDAFPDDHCSRGEVYATSYVAAVPDLERLRYAPIDGVRTQSAQ